MSSTTPNEHRKARSLATIVDGATRARRERRNSRKNPQPWFVLKLTVAIASVIIAYSTYVYVGRLCIPMIKRESDSLGPRTMGIVFLSVFAVLGMMMIWAYIKVVFTPPGSAIKYVQRQSVSDTVGEELPSLENSTSYQDIPPAQTSQPQLPQPSASALPSQISQGSSTRSIPPSSSSLTSPSYPSSRPSRTRQQSRGSSTLHSYTYSTTQSQGPITQPSAENSVHAEYATFPPPPVEKYPRPNSQQPQEQARGREPPALPSLREEHRFCRRCEIVKPPRTHHCRACGMCVMKYDHHCPWIGQCVGAQNQKFFFVFVVWAALFCLWTFSTLVALNARATTRTDKTVDPEHIVVIVLSGLFSVFTSAMLMTHIVLITTNQTTVEHVAARAMKDRENAVLNEMHSFWACAAKRRTRQAWDAEWGRIGLEGNLWWLGDLRAHWEQVFGPRTWTWLLPIGTSKDIGLEYPRNPRFDADGRWIPRKRWPPELQ